MQDLLTFAHPDPIDVVEVEATLAVALHTLVYTSIWNTNTVFGHSQISAITVLYYFVY